eukprot:GHVN01025240.1.p1 GENE.GHVN01025240.1~~GHVN01025240.1.p1  ORF type:complete len:106 (+),score=10.54 GHVN01025240.1:138-455(+)
MTVLHEVVGKGIMTPVIEVTEVMTPVPSHPAPSCLVVAFCLHTDDTVNVIPTRATHCLTLPPYIADGSLVLFDRHVRTSEERERASPTHKLRKLRPTHTVVEAHE